VTLNALGAGGTYVQGGASAFIDLSGFATSDITVNVPLSAAPGNVLRTAPHNDHQRTRARARQYWWNIDVIGVSSLTSRRPGFRNRDIDCRRLGKTNHYDRLNNAFTINLTRLATLSSEAIVQRPVHR